MTANAHGKIVIIIGPSGTGKSTLIQRVKESFPELIESISYTTRPRREKEVDGVHYFFISKEKFFEMRDEGEFLEWAEVHSEYKATGKSFVEKKLKEGKFLLFDLDVQGADSIINVFPNESRAIFIAPPSLTELEKRLKGRGTEDEKSLKVRLENSKKEILRKDDYDYCIINDEVEGAFQRLKETVAAILKGD
ncbi:guanylate kinase [Bacteriovorax sp. BSW11_IV]|uniref:guanylate kinase n=1 Tax=Bacteriovorax sp. BSW11_IV TaxID=1353529 RepID=UPI00038A3776|nr:guanylate kinase [Bacteriovorax sp. BSW11_IV]EQC49535.1 guanylate kinase [Bacteriovorax sp. BSW11_IV]